MKRFLITGALLIAGVAIASPHSHSNTSHRAHQRHAKPTLASAEYYKVSEDAQGNRTVTPGAKVFEKTLENGLKVIVREDRRAPVVVSQVWYKVGSSYEYGGITGISHVLEHMMFKGTEKHGPGELNRIVAENGGRQNAFTGYDYTAYYQIFEKDKLPVSFELEADRMRNLLIPENEFVKEIEVVKEERRMRTEDNPHALTNERFSATAFISNPYHNPIVGWMDDLNHMNVTDLKAWYQKWYAPNNAIVVVVGDVDHDAVFELAQTHFGKLKPEKIAELKPQASSKPLGKRELTVKAPSKLSWVVMGYNVPVVKTAENEWEPYALEVLAGILSGGKSARLDKELVREKQIASDADAEYDAFGRMDSLFMLEATPALKREPEEVKQALLDQVKRLQTEKVSKVELDRVKAQVLAADIYRQDSMEGKAMRIGRFEAVGLPWVLGEQIATKFKAITAEQVQAVAKKYLTEDRLTIAVLDPLPITEKSTPKAMPQGGHHHVQ